MAKYDTYRDDPYSPPGDQETEPAKNAKRSSIRRLVIRWLVVAVVIVVGVASLQLWARLFICDLWGPLFHGRLPGAFGRLCR